MGAGVYTDAEKTIAKSLAVAYGSVDKAHEHLMAVWSQDGAVEGEKDREGNSIFLVPSRVPSPDTIKAWRRDPKIPVDQSLIDDYRDQARQFAVGSAHRIAEAAEEKLINSLTNKGAKTADALNLAKVWGIAVDKMNGRFGNGIVAPGAVVNNGVMIMTYGAAPVPAGAQPIETEFVGGEA